MYIVVLVAALAFVAIIVVNYKRLMQDVNNEKIKKSIEHRDAVKQALTEVRLKVKENEVAYDTAKNNYEAAKRRLSDSNTPNSDTSKK